MLFIFKKLRRSFFKPGKVRTYVDYAFGEIVLIMAGILLALQVSEWNQGRKDGAEETKILLGLKEEFEENQVRLEGLMLSHVKIADAMRAFMTILKPEPEKHPD